MKFAGFEVVDGLGEDENILYVDDDSIYLPRDLMYGHEGIWPFTVEIPEVDLWESGPSDRQIEQAIAWLAVEHIHGIRRGIGGHEFPNADKCIEAAEDLIEGRTSEARADARCGHPSLTAAERN